MIRTMNDVTNTLKKTRARLAFMEAFRNEENPDTVWDLLLEYRRLLGENEHF